MFTSIGDRTLNLFGTVHTDCSEVLFDAQVMHCMLCKQRMPRLYHSDILSTCQIQSAHCVSRCSAAAPFYEALRLCFDTVIPVMRRKQLKQTWCGKVLQVVVAIVTRTSHEGCCQSQTAIETHDEQHQQKLNGHNTRKQASCEQTSCHNQTKLGG